MKHLVIICAVSFLALSMYGCGGGGGGTSSPPDTTKPNNVVITSVTKGGTSVSGTVSGTLVVHASAADNVGVTRVELLVDGVPKYSDTSAPFDLTWYTTTATNAAHDVTVKAYDAAGNSNSSSAMSMTVNNAIAANMLTSVSTTTATATISLAGAPATVQGVQVIVTSPAGAVFASADAIGGATGGLVSPSADPLGTFLGVITTAAFGSGDYLSVSFSNVPPGAVAADFGVILVGVADNNDMIQ
jgi:hypothetical protein